MSNATIRAKIRPFPQAATYLTGWAGQQTFDQIADCLTPLLATILVRYGTYGQDLPDSLQTGLMRLWERLIQDPALLAHYSRWKAAYQVASICKHTTLRKQNRKYLPFSVMEERSGYEVEEHGIRGLSPSSRNEWWNVAEHWATWATKVDERLDITAAMTAVVEECGDDIKRLVALYILTTSVDATAALAAHGLAHSQVYVRMAEIRLKLQTLLADYAPLKSRTWEERYKAGEVEPLMRVIERYRDTPLALKAIDTLTNGTKVLQVVATEKERKMVTYYRKKCRQQIAAAYGQAAAF